MIMMLMLLMIMMKTSVMTMLPYLLTSENVTIIGKMNLIFICLTILLMELVLS